MHILAYIQTAAFTLFQSVLLVFSLAFLTFVYRKSLFRSKPRKRHIYRVYDMHTGKYHGSLNKYAAMSAHSTRIRQYTSLKNRG